ncbi:MAG: hypothetical protein DIZ80_09135 [endosymbiont of Galathealinum brachiosum]|uniref:Uncharacterized protein n=1 Tax=endosymbiont of Galathealinum brachiosum TaxID=2200906 RepID=A0A370DC33_9GAMM|nr:MAG: hypothetical protein DIZ80_09135 [endosymbiont of Galathealinum brachiosum]
MNIKHKLLIGFIPLLFVSQNISAGDYTVPKTYVDGDSLIAADLNAENTNLKAAIDDNNSKATTNTSNITINDGAISTLQSSVTALEGAAAITIITVVGSTSINDGTFGCAIARCPVSHPVATGGGVAPQNVLTMIVTQSSPRINDAAVNTLTADGEYGSPDGWQACAVNNSGSVHQLVATAVCANF